MSFPEKLKRRYLKQAADLIERGLSIEVTENTTYKQVERWVQRDVIQQKQVRTTVDLEAFRPWRDTCVTFLGKILPETDHHKEWIRLANSQAEKPQYVIPWLVGKLRSTRESLELGLFDDVADEVRAELAHDYMSQAKELLDECGRRDHAYIPAAVLAGAVLERRLRELCVENSISTVKPNGAKKTLDPLIDDLKRAGLIQGPQAKLLKSYAGIRNQAAHGEWDQFSRDEVVTMLQGIKLFVERA